MTILTPIWGNHSGLETVFSSRWTSPEHFVKARLSYTLGTIHRHSLWDKKCCHAEKMTSCKYLEAREYLATSAFKWFGKRAELATQLLQSAKPNRNNQCLTGLAHKQCAFDPKGAVLAASLLLMYHGLKNTFASSEHNQRGKIITEEPDFRLVAGQSHLLSPGRDIRRLCSEFSK